MVFSSHTFKSDFLKHANIFHIAWKFQRENNAYSRDALCWPWTTVFLKLASSCRWTGALSCVHHLIYHSVSLINGLPRWDSGKESACQCKRFRRHRFDPWVRKNSWSRKRQSTPVFLLGTSVGQRSLAVYSSLGSQRSLTWLSSCIHTYFPSQMHSPALQILMLYAAAKSLHSCPTLCDPIDSSPPGSPIPGILQAKTLEWVAISFSNAWEWKVKVKWLSRVQLCNPMGCSLPGSSFHGIFQARVLEWGAIAFSTDAV